jgi:hypothetical protein
VTAAPRALRLVLLAAAVLLLGRTPAAAQAPDVNPHGKLEWECSTCHRAEGWTPVRITKAFDHGKKGFPLVGAHAAAPCRACHVSLDFRGADRNCVACHKDVHQGELGMDCSRCHTPRSFLDRSAMVRAHRETRFPLTGAHISADCESCHAPTGQGHLTFVSLSGDCVQCHLASFQTAQNPNHQAGGFPTDCNQCHSTAAWPLARFSHVNTGFPLTGAHLAVPCMSCHGDGVYKGKNTACVSCHQKDYAGVTDPNHVTAAFPTDCTQCHTTNAWTGATFDHTTTKFPLTGAHKAVSCQQCHADGVYAGKSTACASCHQADYNTTTNPSHTAAQFPTDCTQCHTTTAWTGATFNHGQTAFPLTGAHTSATCQQCHGDGVYVGKSTACVSCHQTDYNGTTNPGHAAAQFPTDCTQCHTTTAWTGATFNHDGPFFPIYSGKHQGKWTTCSQCHDNPSNYAQFTCLTCHGQSQTNSNHSGVSGYSYTSQACYSCHPRP